MFDKLYNTIIVFICFVTKLLAVSELPQKNQNIQLVSNIYSLCCNSTATAVFFFCWVQRLVWAKCLENQSAKWHTTNSANLGFKIFQRLFFFFKINSNYCKIYSLLIWLSKDQECHIEQKNRRFIALILSLPYNPVYSYPRHVSKKYLYFAITAHRALKMCRQIIVC